MQFQIIDACICSDLLHEIASSASGLRGVSQSKALVGCKNSRDSSQAV